MTDVATTEVPKTEEKPAETEGEGAPKQLREALKTEKAKNAKLTKQLMGTAYADAGLDPETGLGKAIAKEYKGDPTEEGLLAFAKEEYGYEKPEVSTEHPKAAEIKTEQKKLDDARAVSGATVPLGESEALQKATAEGDLETAGRIKAAQLRRKMNP